MLLYCSFEIIWVSVFVIFNFYSYTVSRKLRTFNELILLFVNNALFCVFYVLSFRILKSGQCFRFATEIIDLAH